MQNPFTKYKKIFAGFFLGIVLMMTFGVNISIASAQAWALTPGFGSTNETNRVNAQTFAKAQEIASKKPGPINCGIITGNIKSCIAELAYIFLKGCALLLQIVGMLFNIAINFTLNIGGLIPQGGSNPGPLGLGGSTGVVYVGWSTIRDFANVAFIFVLLFAAISIILQNDKYGLTKTVTKVVIAALLLNFSLFFTKVIIDLSNIIALQFYTRILDASDRAFKASGGNSNDSIDSGLSGGLRSAIGLESLWGAANLKGQTGGTTPPGSAQELSTALYNAPQRVVLDPGTMISLCIFGGIFILVFSFVLFMATIQFLIRSIVLLLLMITSPVGFLGGAIPALQGVSSDWWKRLKNNVIFAPAYMAVMYIACQMIFGNARGSIGGGNLATLINTDDKTGAIGVAFWFAIVIGFLLAAQVTARGFADKFGSSFTGKAEKMFKGTLFGAGKLAMRPAKGAASGVTRVALGNTGRALSENKLLQRMATSKWTKHIGGQSLYNSIKNMQDIKVGGKSYKDSVDNRVKRDKTTFERLGEKTVRRKANESDESFKIRETQAKNEATMARARFMGVEKGQYLHNKLIMDASGNAPIMVPKAGLSPGNALSEITLTDAAFEAYKKRTSQTFGTGRRKGRKEVGKMASPTSKKGSAEDIQTQIEALAKDLQDTSAKTAKYNNDLAIYEGMLTKFESKQHPTNDPMGRLIAGTGTSHDLEEWNKIKSALENHTKARKSDEEKLANLGRQLKQLENQDKK